MNVENKIPSAGACGCRARMASKFISECPADLHAPPAGVGLGLADVQPSGGKVDVAPAQRA
ncbi:MAG: hypothetical protein ABSG95_12810 [Solirubrobacteraceae bacterium]